MLKRTRDKMEPNGITQAKDEGVAQLPPPPNGTSWKGEIHVVREDTLPRNAFHSKLS